MALIKCPECGRDTSSVAVACPGCGHPIAGAAGGEPVQTIQATGKRYKGMLLAGYAIMGLGALLAFTASGVLGGLIFFIGLVVGAAAQGLAWWHHR